jgi:histidinol phosphatase-like enzyme (inositol monophosphatase family)
MMAGHTVEDDLTLACLLADEAAKAILPIFRTPLVADNKALAAKPGAAPVKITRGRKTEEKPAAPPFDPVTEADREAEKAIRTLLKTARPQQGVVGEEFDEIPSVDGYSWFIDPIDGTRAFMAGLPVWTTLIALVDPEGEPVIGVIDQPVLGERYLGWPGGAALECAGQRQPIRVSQGRDLRTSVIATTDPFIFTPSEQGAWNHLRAAAQISRYGLDAYAYARLAAGTIDLVAESGLKPWDVAALIPVVRGAGGLATDWRGGPPQLGGQFVCAANEAILEQALIALRRSAELV